MKDKYRIILAAEESFARRVVLSEIVMRPINPWKQIIPGMFLFDFLKRTAEIRSYTKYFMFPRLLAMDIAEEVGNRADYKDRIPLAEEKIRSWLRSVKLNSPEIGEAFIALLHLLKAHYEKLFHSYGEEYHSLVRNAYQTMENYDAHLKMLTSLEQNLIKMIIEFPNSNNFQNIIIKQPHIEGQRRRLKEEIFIG